jgi:hypothetical protein
MLQNKREKILAGVFLGIVALSGGQDAVNAVVFGPLDAKDAQIAGLTQKVSNRELEFGRIEHAQRELRPLREQSLPPDPSVATTLYQNWLIETAKASGITSVQIVPSRAVEEDEVGYRIPVTVQGTMPTAQLGAFLDRFYSTPLLHRITSLSVTGSEGRGNSQPRVTISLEALALKDANPRTDLSDVATIVEHAETLSAEKLANVSARQFFTARDPFLRGYNGPPARPTRSTVPTRPAAVDPLTQIRLVASLHVNGQTEVWFFNSSTKQQTVVVEGSGFDFAGLQGRLLSADADAVVVEIDGEQRRLPMGQTLKLLQSRS